MDATIFSADTFAKQIDINWMGVVHALDAIIPDLVDRGSGRIAVVGSVSGYRGLRTAAAYGATKAALINMCEALHMELADYGVKVQIVNPGFIDTPLTAKNDFRMPALMPVEKAANALHRVLAIVRNHLPGALYLDGKIDASIALCNLSSTYQLGNKEKILNPYYKRSTTHESHLHCINIPGTETTFTISQIK